MITDKILLDHGSGGRMSQNLIADFMLPFFDNAILSPMHDGAIIDIQGIRIAYSTDSFVVDPIFFPGGSIGDLAVNGSVNDIAMCGAKPLYLSVGLIIEEGFSIEDLKKILKGMKSAADRAGIMIVTGDTKVVPKGAADKIFINTSGIGLIPESVNVIGSNARPKDVVILSGSIANHGICILTQREGLTFDSHISSDTAPLHRLVERMLSVTKNIHVLRDPTRGGVATALNEIALSSKVGIRIYEEKIPVDAEVRGVCELLGVDPLYLANEGKLLAFVKADNAEDVLAAMQADEVGENSCIIGEVVSDSPGLVYMKTSIGGTRIVDMLTGNPLPRIC